MRRFFVGFLLLAGCQGNRTPPIVAGDGLNIAEGTEARTISLNASQIVLTRAACEEGGTVKREGDGWVCTTFSEENKRDSDLIGRIVRLEQARPLFTTVRGCQVSSDPGANLKWVADCVTHSGLTAAPLVLRCPVALSTDNPGWNQLFIWADDADLSTPDASTVDVSILTIDTMGVANGRGFQRVNGTTRALGSPQPQVATFTAVNPRAFELEVTLKTEPTVAASYPRARFCGFGLAAR